MRTYKDVSGRWNPASGNCRNRRSPVRCWLFWSIRQILQEHGIMHIWMMDWMLKQKNVIERCAQNVLSISRCSILPGIHILWDTIVDERVLVPRQDTEVLVEEAISRMRNLEKPQILDMCTGSGCILLSLLLELPQALGTGVDVSEGALCVAKENRKRLGLGQRAELIQVILFSADYFGKTVEMTTWNMICLFQIHHIFRTEDIEGLMEEVRFHDPVLALDGKENGLYFYEKITEQAGTYLKPGGWLM